MRGTRLDKKIRHETRRTSRLERAGRIPIAMEITLTSAPPRSFRLLPFRAVRYADDADLGALISPPYDVIDDEQRARLLARHPRNVVRLILPDDGPATDRYTNAATLFDDWLSEGTLTVDDTPALYVYQQSRDGSVLQRGLFGAVVWQPLDAGVILPHENVRKGPVEDRLALMRAMGANPEPIYLLASSTGATCRITAETAAKPPLSTAHTPDGITHELWAITDPADLAEIDADLSTKQAMIADGHHRYTTYGYLRAELRDAGAGDGPWDAGLTLLVDGDVTPPDIRAIHRAIPGLSLDEAIRRASSGFEIHTLDISDVGSALAELARATAGDYTPAFVISDGARFALLSNPDKSQLAAAKPAEHTDAWWRLDASIASIFLMEKLFGVTDAAGQVEAEHEPEAALRIARETDGIALFLNPAPLSGIVAVAEAGDAMPRKSTLFLPKPSSGMVMRAFRYETGE